ncbi:type VII secretion target [Nocardia lasii]|uniref:Type VII secretion target n=1 Tax=Nocardia lasii TaxID=1616107 RepID=A0ABW1JVZ6_9NOCA
MSPTLGVEPDQLTTIATTWRREGAEVEALSWAAMGEAGGVGSEVLAAVRELADPARQAMTSIAERYSTLADLVDRFSADIQATDAAIAGEISKLGAR